MHTETLIIGGGLAGLSLAHHLSDRDLPFLLVEARDRFGGRILTQMDQAGYFDMGPAWFWPGQPRIAALIKALELEQFEQHYLGDLLFEDDRGNVQRGRGHASMQGSLRIVGGMAAMTSGLHQHLPSDQVRSATAIQSLRLDGEKIVATSREGTEFSADRIVLAMPPRLAARLAFDPPLPDQTLHTMEGVATWMAGQAKAVAVYDAPFWRDAGLSGDAMSRAGPMVEIHDASPAAGGPYALFGFLGVPPEFRQDKRALRAQIGAQLGRLFGLQAASPAALHIKDWAFDPNTSAKRDLEPLYAHPDYGLPPALDGVWGGRLIFGGTEVAPQFGGYLEGALEAAEIAIIQIQRDR